MINDNIVKQDYFVSDRDKATTRCCKIDYFTAKNSDCKQPCMRKCPDINFESICDYTKICSKYIGENVNEI